MTGGIILEPISFVIGAMLPDADHRRTLIGKFIPLWLLFGHRKQTHTIYFILVIGLITGLFLGVWVGCSIGAGIFTHLLLDSCTPSGVKWLGTAKRR